MTKGDRVILSDGVRHADFRGLHGTVKRVVKKGFNGPYVTVVCDNGKLYDADPENVMLEERSCQGV